jgi:uncharacterized protein (DUF697 family)
MASIFELESPVFAREVSGITVVAAGNEATTLTAAQSVDSLVRMTPSAGRTVTTATAAAIVAEIAGCRVGSSFRLILRNEAAATHAMTLAGGTGVTLQSDNTNTVAHAASREFIGEVTNVTSSSEAVTLYSMPSGTH